MTKQSATLYGVLHDPLTHGERTGHQWNNWEALNHEAEDKQREPYEAWSAHLNRHIDTRYESDTCAFCGAHIDPDTAYHRSICRRCV